MAQSTDVHRDEELDQDGGVREDGAPVDLIKEFQLYLEEQARETAAGKLIGRPAAQFRRDMPTEIQWLIPGLLPRGWVGKLAAREKAGKGTLVTYLIGCGERGEPTVFGDPPAPFKTCIVTEEPEDSLHEKLELFGIDEAHVIFGADLNRVLTESNPAARWAQKVERIVDEATATGCQLVFVDNISRASWTDDENGVELGRRLEVLQDQLRVAGLAALVDHHHKKGAGAIEDKSRGGTALAGACDVNIDMVRQGGHDSRTRKVTSLGRRRATTWTRIVELSEDGRTYVGHATSQDDDATTTDRAAERLLMDKIALTQLGETTVTEFMRRIGLSKNPARNRLEALVAGGHATVDKARAPHVFRPVVSGQELDN